MSISVMDKESKKRLQQSRGQSKLSTILKYAADNNWLRLSHCTETDKFNENWVWVTPAGVLIDINYHADSGYLSVDNRAFEWERSKEED